MNMLPRLRVHERGHFLVTEQGEPFLWLGDTAWELFHRLTREEAEHYLENRRQKGFSVIQAVVLTEVDGLGTPNAYGHRPLADDDPLKPDEAYFGHVDYVLQTALEKGLYVGFLPTWGDKVLPAWARESKIIFDPEKAYSYGKFLGSRYRGVSNIIWVLGGDRVADGNEEMWRRMAEGIRAGAEGEPLMTYHPQGGYSSSAWFHQDPWLSLNMQQSGHDRRDKPNWERIAHDYALEPAKPVLDGEANYEDHPINWNAANGYFDDYDVRRQAYRALFAGACGHTYGHQSIWQFYDQGREPIAFPKMYWQEALDRPGACQLQWLRNLLYSRPFLTRIPAQDLLVSDPGEGIQHVQATRCEQRSFAFIYIPTAGQSVTVSMREIGSDEIAAWWYDPRTGSVSHIGEYSAAGTQEFTTPEVGPDWVLVLDDVSRDFGVPGQVLIGS